MAQSFESVKEYEESLKKKEVASKPAPKKTTATKTTKEK